MKLHKDKISSVAVIISNNPFNTHFAAIKAFHRNKKISFIGGTIDSGETPEEAAIRETKEECGLIIKDVRLIAYKKANTKICAVITTDFWMGMLRSSEEGEAFWATREELTGNESAYPEWNAWAFSEYDKFIKACK